MSYVILYRNGIEWKDESEAASEHFKCVDSRLDIESENIVIGRYSVLPFYKEQERDIEHVGAKLINTYRQHQYVADIKNWSSDLQGLGLTPRTWFRLEALPDEGPFILKGETNSKKYYWKTHMFAKDKREAIEVHSRLLQDSLISQQEIVIRQYVPLYTYMEGLQGLPITKEFRFFVLYGYILCGGYYWSSHVDDLEEVPDPNEVPKEFLEEVINAVRGQINFYTIDVGQTITGDWIVIELNDGQMSGISENDPKKLYAEMKNVLDRQEPTVIESGFAKWEGAPRNDHSPFCSRAFGDVSDCICTDWHQNPCKKCGCTAPLGDDFCVICK